MIGVQVTGCPSAGKLRAQPMTDSLRDHARLKDLRARREEILASAHRRGAFDVRVFGSVVRGEETPASDVDFLVRFAPDHRLLDHVGLKVDLERLLGCPVDVANADALRDEFKDAILAEAVPL